MARDVNLKFFAATNYIARLECLAVTLPMSNKPITQVLSCYRCNKKPMSKMSGHLFIIKNPDYSEFLGTEDSMAQELFKQIRSVSEEKKVKNIMLEIDGKKILVTACLLRCK
jgi:hypothetical protein